MHLYLVIIPAIALLVGPRWWVEQVRKRRNREEIDTAPTGGELARKLLDLQKLNSVAVERTDIGDHYDPQRKAVRLTRDNFERRSVAALATAAHEVGHALQDAGDYAPFRWRAELVRLARVTGEAGGVLLVATPLAAFLTRSRVPPIVIGSTALAVIGTGVAAQLAALPTEWDASFRRALPLLEDGYLEDDQIDGAKEMLLACSLTYVASSLASALQLWPWLPRRPMMLSCYDLPPSRQHGETNSGMDATAGNRPTARARTSGTSTVRTLVRVFGKPLIRNCYRARAAISAGATPQHCVTSRGTSHRAS